MAENLSDEEYKKVVENLKDKIISNTKKHIVQCKICGLGFKQNKQPLYKTEDGYICRACKNKYGK